MDPDKARARLAELAEVIIEADAEAMEWETLLATATESAETFVGLDEWIQRGGFLPVAWNSSAVAERNSVQSQAGSSIRAIHGLMDGVEWSPATLDAIAEVLRTAGFTIREPAGEDDQ